jgi:hypothetical protein
MRAPVLRHSGFLTRLATWCLVGGLLLAFRTDASSSAVADEWIYFLPESQPAASRETLPFLTKQFLETLARHSRPTSLVPDEESVAPSGSTWSSEHSSGIRSEFFRDPNAVSMSSREQAAELPLWDRQWIQQDWQTRLGWWEIWHSGAAIKVAEYEDLNSSVFWSAERLKSDGTYTLDLFAVGTDNESSQADLYFFAPRMQIDLQYDRFLHRLDHDPLTNLGLPNSGEEIVGEDLNVGEDYVVRIQDIRTELRGKLTSNMKYRVKLWLRRKHGERQALGTHHGAPGVTDCTTCHVVNQRQTIDWTTATLEPIIETKLGPIRAEYSRPMRSFSQDDGIVLRSYGGFHGYDYAGDFPYAVVPDTLTQTDRLRISADLPADTSLYSSLHRGDTRNNVRDTQRDFHGFDIRLTNRLLQRLTLDVFSRYNRQLNELPSFLVPPEDDAVAVPTSIVPPYGLRHPIDYSRISAGASAKWYPMKMGKLRIRFGAEYGEIDRSYADYVVPDTDTVFSQASTPYTSYFVGAATRWHPRFDTYVRYKGRLISDPLFGVNLYSGITNTSLPEQEGLIQVGGTWAAADNLVASVNCGIQNRENDSDIAYFVEDNYPITVTVWYSPMMNWSISGGFGHYSNWIDQDIYFPSDQPLVNPLDLRRWNYGGRGQLISLGSSYRLSENVTLLGNVNYVRGTNVFDPLEPWPDLPLYSDVVVNTIRGSCGADWSINERISAYLRYIYNDYDDQSLAFVSGTSHMLLSGMTGTF